LVLPTADRLLDGPLVVPSPGCASRLPFALRAADVGSSRELLFLAGALSCGAAFPVLDPVLGSVLGALRAGVSRPPVRPDREPREDRSPGSSGSDAAGVDLLGSTIASSSPPLVPAAGVIA